MNKILRTFIAGTALLWGALSVCAQEPESSVSWSVSVKDGGNGIYEVMFSGGIADGLHTYSVTDSTSPTEITFTVPEGVSLEGGLYDLVKPKEEDGSLVFYKRIVIGQKVKAGQEADTLKGEICWISCTENACNSPEYYEFAVEIPGTGSAVLTGSGETTIGSALTEEEEKAGGSIWGLVLEAILWGFAMLLTPCVFPMVPMTISFFMKGSSTPAAGRFKAFMYGLFIILLYTVPISAIIGITWIVGGDAVTADIFNWLATHWLPNIIFFIVFMVFAASFFGAFEISLPSSLVNKSDQNSDKGGLAGIFFMALTLVLVSSPAQGRL